jgi:hypothetical protein
MVHFQWSPNHLIGCEHTGQNFLPAGLSAILLPPFKGNNILERIFVRS